jgi:hypothetical protein
MKEIGVEESVSKLSQDLLDELHVTYLERSQEKGFPDGCCTRVNKDVASNLGFRYREGQFKLDFPNSEGELLPDHAWCEDTDKIIIDLTAHQFNRNLNKPVFEGVQIIRPEDPLYQRYMPLEKSPAA